MSESLDELPDHIKLEYTAIREAANGSIIGVKPLLFHWTIHADIHFEGYVRRWCYVTKEDAVHDYAVFTGEGDPPGRWHRSVHGNISRDPDTGETWEHGEMQPSKIKRKAK